MFGIKWRYTKSISKIALHVTFFGTMLLYSLYYFLFQYLNNCTSSLKEDVDKVHNLISNPGSYTAQKLCEMALQVGCNIIFCGEGELSKSCTVEQVREAQQLAHRAVYSLMEQSVFLKNSEVTLFLYQLYLKYAFYMTIPMLIVVGFSYGCYRVNQLKKDSDKLYDAIFDIVNSKKEEKQEIIKLREELPKAYEINPDHKCIFNLDIMSLPVRITFYDIQKEEEYVHTYDAEPYLKILEVKGVRDPKTNLPFDNRLQVKKVEFDSELYEDIKKSLQDYKNHNAPHCN